MVLTGGKSVQVGTRRELFETPRSTGIARLLGIANVFHGEPYDGEVHCGPWRFPFEGARHAGRVLIAVNERRISLTTEKDHDGVRGIVTDLIDLGTYAEIIVTLTTTLALRVKGDHVNAPPVGERVGVLLEDDAVSIWSVTDVSANLEQGVPR